MKISRFLILTVIFSMLFSFVAFADDLEPVENGSSSSASDRLATDEELQELDNAISETSHSLALLMASGDSVRATDYEQATYNLLSSVFGSSSSSWASIVATRLGYLSTINSSANSLVVKLTGFYNSINPDYDTTGISMYDVVHGLLTSLTTIDPDDGDLTIIETLVYIHTKLEDLETSLSAILNSTYSIDSKIVNLHNFIINFRTDMNTGFNNVLSSLSSIITNTSQLITNTANTVTAINNLDNHLNNIEWLDSSSLYLGFNFDQSSNYITGTFDVSANPVGYFIFSNPALNYGRFYRFRLPVRGYLPKNEIIKSITFIYNNSDYINPEYYDYDYSRGYIDVYCNAPTQYASNKNVIIKVEFSHRYIISSDTYPVYYINRADRDYYTIYEYITYLKQNRIFNKFESLYASDDLIKAKEEQQNYEDSVIGDFTGNGSASAKLSDAISAKDTSNAVKNGLATGASAGKALGAFDYNNPAGLYIWFTQDVANWFTVYTPTRGHTDYNSIQWTDNTTDVLSEIDNQYYEGLDNAR